MNFLSQNWLWIAVAIGAVFFMFRGGHGGFGRMGHGGFGSMGHGGHGSHGHGRDRDRLPDRASETVGASIDPVSGAAVRTDGALTSVYKGRVFYFASKENRDRFEAAPAEFAGKASGVELPSTVERPRRRGGC